MTLYNGSECNGNSDVTFCAFQTEESMPIDYQYKDPNIINDKIVYQGGDSSGPAVDCGKVKTILKLVDF